MVFGFNCDHTAADFQLILGNNSVSGQGVDCQFSASLNDQVALGENNAAGIFIFGKVCTAVGKNSSGGILCSPHGGRTVVGWFDGHATSEKACMTVVRQGANPGLSVDHSVYSADPFAFGSSKG